MDPIVREMIKTEKNISFVTGIIIGILIALVFISLTFF